MTTEQIIMGLRIQGIRAEPTHRPDVIIVDGAHTTVAQARAMLGAPTRVRAPSARGPETNFG